MFVAALAGLALAGYSIVRNRFAARSVEIADTGWMVALVCMVESPVVVVAVIAGTTAVGFPFCCWLVAWWLAGRW